MSRPPMTIHEQIRELLTDAVAALSDGDHDKASNLVRKIREIDRRTARRELEKMVSSTNEPWVLVSNYEERLLSLFRRVFP